MRFDRPGSSRRNNKRRKICRSLRLERLEVRDLMTVNVVAIAPVDNVLFTGEIATFESGDVAGTLGQFTATVNWGDSTSTSTTSTIDPVSIVQDPTTAGQYDVIASKTYTSLNNYPVIVTVTGSDLLSAAGQSTATVTGPLVSLTPVSIKPTAGVALPATTTVATFPAPESSSPSDYTATVNWGAPTTTGVNPGPSTTATIVPDPSKPGIDDVDATYQYAQAGTYTLNVSVQDKYSIAPALTVSPTAVVSGLSSLVLNGIPISSTVATPPAPITVGVPFTNVPVANLFLSGTAPSASQYLATINWGSGLPTTQGFIVPVTGSTNQFVVEGSYNYATAGTYDVSVTVTNESTGAASTATTSATVIGSPQSSSSIVGSGTPISTTASQVFSGQVATFSDTSATPSTNPGSFSALINWGDNQITPGTIADNSTNSNFAVFGSHTYATANTYPISVVVTRVSDNQSVTISSSAVVDDFTASLDPSIHYALSNNIPTTNLNQPTLVGSAEPNAIVRLFAQKSDGSPQISLGETVAGSNGLWKTTLLPLADGTYSIIGESIPTTGSPDQPIVLTTFLVDTVPPQVVGLNLNTTTGKLTVTFQDDRSGMNLATLLDFKNYELIGPGHSVISAVSAAPGSTVAAIPSDPVSVVVSFHLSSKQRGQSHSLRLVAGGITDLAGNALVGEIFGPVATSKTHAVSTHPVKPSHPAKPVHPVKSKSKG